jgi:hypothetical protein
MSQNKFGIIDSYQKPILRGHIYLRTMPHWAVLERHLFDVLDSSWPIFQEKFCNPDGSLIFNQSMDHSRDGADDFYESFFNWPAFYMLGGSEEILNAAKKSWKGVTKQLTELGLVKDDYERGYDWFHQGESMIFFYSICAADPNDKEFRALSKKFAELYAGDNSPNYDRERNIIPAPHNGSDGLRPGLGQEWVHGYPPDSINSVMKPYGLPLHYVEGIETWEDLSNKENAMRMAEHMEKILGYGDVAVNLAATSLVANDWLYDHRDSSASWIKRYIQGWVDRANANDGIIPDNVAPDGNVGGLHDGRWFGGHYGWTWPHGFYSVTHAALVAGLNQLLLFGDQSALELTRTVLKKVTALGKVSTIIETESSLQAGTERFGVPVDAPVLLVPYRYGKNGWFDYSPMIMSQPIWLWYLSMSKDDEKFMEELIEGISPYGSYISPTRNKEEAGHEAPWFRYLQGKFESYPEEALSMALGQVARRMRLMETEVLSGPGGVNIHFWQEVQPIVTEILTQLTVGAPQVLYNGGLQLTRLRYFDADAGRIGLPPDVAALVTKITRDETHVELVNTSVLHTRKLVILGGAFGEHHIESVTHLSETVHPDEMERLVDGYESAIYSGDQATSAHFHMYPGSRRAYGAPELLSVDVQTPINSSDFAIEIPPNSIAKLQIKMKLNANKPRFISFEDLKK